MSSELTDLSGPDLARGLPLSEIPDAGTLAGHADGKPVVLARQGEEIFAVGGMCTHYGGPLAEGLVVGDTVRCPWHHACFSLRTGEAVRAPALKPLSRWAIERREGRIFVTRELEPHSRKAAASVESARAAPSSVVIIGGGAAGDAAADTLRREGYEGPITIVAADESPPYDRPNLSKDYLAGTAPEEWIPLRPATFYEENDIALVLGRRVTVIDVPSKRVTLDDGRSQAYGALLFATGATPVRLPTPLFGGSRIHYLRTLADSRAIIAATEGARRAVVLGASFIGLEVAASLRARGLEVHVVAPESRPLEKVMGRELGDFIRGLHEANGVIFHMASTASQVDVGVVTLGSGERIPADLVVAGIGVRPNDELALQAGLAVDRGILVNEYLETRAPDVFAAGDVARYPEALTGNSIRIEHWVVAQRQGQTAARNILGHRERFDAVPFFWSRHYDISISYVGHAEHWDEVDIDGSVENRDCTVSFREGGKALAVATVGRDRASLQAEVSMELRDSALAASAAAG